MIKGTSGESPRLRFIATQRSGEVSAIFNRPPDARALLVLAHGAGAGMDHPFLAAVAQCLADAGIATFRYQFPYLETGKRSPDPPAILEATVRSAVARAAAEAPDLPVFAGGKSMGGRMTSQAAARSPLANVHGIIFLGFPLHAPKRPSDARGEHLAAVNVPMLFLQGTRDDLADLTLLRPLCEKLGDRATLHVVEGADHSFHMLKRSGRTDADVIDELATKIGTWTDVIRS